MVGLRKLGGSAAIIALVLFSTCENSFDILADVKDEVKLANDKYLVVADVFPVPDANDVNPGQLITVKFDRAIKPVADWRDVLQVSADGLPVDLAAWSLTYTSGINTLFATPYPPLSNRTIKVTIPGSLNGSDGSAMREPKTWSYKTNDDVTYTIHFGETSTKLLYANKGLSDDHGTILPIYYTISESSGYKYFITDKNILVGDLPFPADSRWKDFPRPVASSWITPGLPTATARSICGYGASLPAKC